VLALALAMGCSSDDPAAPPAPPPPPSFEDLTLKDHVIDNLELCYRQRDLDELSLLLDDGFTFFFSDEDVTNSGTPVSWMHDDELLASARILGANPAPDRVVSIVLDIAHDQILWNETIVVIPGGTESWWSTALVYSYNFTTAEGVSFTGSGMEAIFTVRNAGTVSEPQWRLVRWDDLAGGSARSSGVERSAAVEEVSWGLAKWAYYPGSGSAVAEVNRP
jgi:hypothetical protein